MEFTFPVDYRQFLLMSNGTEGTLDDGSYVQILPIEELEKANIAYEFTTYARAIFCLPRIWAALDSCSINIIGMDAESR